MFPDSHMIGYTFDGVPVLKEAKAGAGGDIEGDSPTGQEPLGLHYYSGDRAWGSFGEWIPAWLVVGEGGDCEGGEQP